MPTRNRRLFVPRAIQYFLCQDYLDRELIILDDGTDPVGDLVPDDPRVRYLSHDPPCSLGAKRNLACQEAKGEIIVHWDDDDWMASWRLSYQVTALLREQKDICGLNRLLFYDAAFGRAWQYVYPKQGRPWLAGGTLCYSKAFWSTNPFPDVNAGEDTRFVWSSRSEKILCLPDCTFYVALIHRGNTSRKRTGDTRWHSYPVAQVQNLMREDWTFYAKPFRDEKLSGHNAGGSIEPQQSYHEQHLPPQVNLAQPLSARGAEHFQAETLGNAPLVSCVMPTCDRRSFVLQAIKYFMRQDYLNLELIIVDDGSDPVGDVIPDDSRVRYIRLPRKHDIGEKRNLACEAAQGEVIACWDDDDWHAQGRISYQVAPLLGGRADLTGLTESLMLSLPSRQFWMCTPQLHARLFSQGVIGGTLVFWKRLWSQVARFPNISLAEDAAFLQTLVRRGAHLEKLANTGTFVYVRHGTNSWRFTPGNTLDRAGWQLVDLPTFVPDQDLEFYGIRRPPVVAGPGVRRKRRPGAQASGEPAPLASCVLAVGDRRQFLRQAVKCFMRQTYHNKELVIVDDGLDSATDFVPDDDRIRYVKLEPGRSVGNKLNIGIQEAGGQIIQKIDDDDYYHPEFLATTVSTLRGNAPARSIVGFDCFLVLIAETGELKFSGYGWCAGGTLCFFRQLWEKRPFREDTPFTEDWWFLKDHAPQQIKIRKPELYVLVRHGLGHGWTRIGQMDVTEYFRRQPAYSKSFRDCLPAEDWAFYESLRHIAVSV